MERSGGGESQRPPEVPQPGSPPTCRPAQTNAGKTAAGAGLHHLALPTSPPKLSSHTKQLRTAIPHPPWLTCP